jgi:hypothetical protein
VAPRSDGWVSPGELLAGIAVARVVAAGRDHAEALAHLKAAPADLTALDYEGAEGVASRHGWQIFSSHDDDFLAIRATLSALTVKAEPAWMKNVDRGRIGALASLDDDAVQCFRLGGLLEWDDSALDWWLEQGKWARAQRDLRKRAAGEAAERRSLAIERALLAGTGLPVDWISVHDGNAGYDIATWRETRPNEAAERTADGRGWRRHHVEVKSALGGELIISRAECVFAERNEALWSLHVWRTVNALREATWSQLKTHLPTDNGNGKWEQARVSLVVLKA